LEELAKKLFPEEEIEVYVIPAQDGCHQDSFWIKVKENPLVTGLLIAFFSAVATLPNHISQIVTDSSTRQLNKSQIELNALQAEQIKAELDKNIPDNKITLEQCRSLLTSEEIKKQRSRHFEQLQVDGEIKKEKFVAKAGMNKVLQEKTIESIDFPKYVESLPPSESTIKTVEKIHKLIFIQPVNEREHKDLSWQVEDFNQKKKFGVCMADEGFYELHFENIFGLKSLVARVRYTVQEDENGILTFSQRNKEIVTVYSYNGIERVPLPEKEAIEPAPFQFDKTDGPGVKTILQKSTPPADTPTLFSSIEF